MATGSLFAHSTSPRHLSMELNPQDLASGDRYKLLIGSVVPRPIAFVSSLSPQGVTNLAPFSYFNAVGHSPMALMFSVSQKPNQSAKDTLRNVCPVSEGGTGEYVINLAVESYIQQVAEAAEPLPYGESEFDHLDLTTVPSQVIAPPRVAESPVAFECKTLQIVPVGTFSVVIGEVVHLYVRDDLVDENYRVNTDRVAAVGRMAGYDYCRTRDRFTIPNGFPPEKKAALPQ
jgi:flavin reductase (DIM6/NTAB) family NADH-FMN oxidoreductase RutF